jgi:hypothetical protein
MHKGEVLQILGAAAASRPNMLKSRPYASLGVESQRPIADQALAHPVGADATEGGVCLGNAPELVGESHEANDRQRTRRTRFLFQPRFHSNG